MNPFRLIDWGHLTAVCLGTFLGLTFAYWAETGRIDGGKVVCTTWSRGGAATYCTGWSE